MLLVGRKGLPGEPVRDMLVGAVERRFGIVEAMRTGVPHRQRQPLRRARDARHCQIVGTQADQYASVQPAERRHGRELFNTFKRDYMSRMDQRDTPASFLDLPSEVDERSFRTGPVTLKVPQNLVHPSFVLGSTDAHIARALGPCFQPEGQAFDTAHSDLVREVCDALSGNTKLPVARIIP